MYFRELRVNYIVYNLLQPLYNITLVKLASYIISFIFHILDYLMLSGTALSSLEM